MADQTTTKPADLIYEDTGALAPLVYFDIVGAYSTMNGTVEVELATRILVPKPDGTTEVKFISSGRIRCSQNAAVSQYGCGRGFEAELSGSTCNVLAPAG